MMMEHIIWMGSVHITHHLNGQNISTINIRPSSIWKWNVSHWIFRNLDTIFYSEIIGTKNNTLSKTVKKCVFCAPFYTFSCTNSILQFVVMLMNVGTWITSFVDFSNTSNKLSLYYVYIPFNLFCISCVFFFSYFFSIQHFPANS